MGLGNRGVSAWGDQGLSKTLPTTHNTMDKDVIGVLETMGSKVGKVTGFVEFPNAIRSDVVFVGETSSMGEVAFIKDSGAEGGMRLPPSPRTDSSR